VKIVVLVKQVPDTWGERKLNLDSGWLDRASSDAVIDEIDERALEVALSYQDSSDAEVIALSMGPDSAKDVLRKALAMGADSAIHIVDDRLAGADLITTSRVIAAALTKSGFDLVIAGNESTDGRGGVIPALIAEHLGVRQATYLDSVDITADSVRGQRGTENGSMSVRASLPAVISVTEQSAEARFPNFKGIMRAKKKPVVVWSLGDLGIDAASPADSGHSVVLSTSERPARSAGIKIVDDGTAGVALADFLAAGHLI
jgi:electron transfer flavoprotein beta subunit